MLELKPTEVERARRDEVMDHTLRSIRDNTRIVLPPFQGGEAGSDFALHRIPRNDFSGTVGDYRYQLEGEDDLLHLIVLRSDEKELSVQDGRQVATFVFPNIPAAVIWLKPGQFSQHFYLGHDELL
jgi:hypothetical protein